MKRNRRDKLTFWLVQAIVVAGVGISAARGGSGRVDLRLWPGAPREVVHIEREKPLWIESLYDDPLLVSDDELASVLKQVQPRFSPKNLRPNYVEHALRIWGEDARFSDPEVLSGVQLRDLL